MRQFVHTLRDFLQVFNRIFPIKTGPLTVFIAPELYKFPRKNVNISQVSKTFFLQKIESDEKFPQEFNGT